MIVWTEDFPLKERLLGYFRLCKARFYYHNYYAIKRVSPFRLKLMHRSGYQDQIADLRNKHKGKRCFIMGNGPSLKKWILAFCKMNTQLVAMVFTRILTNGGGILITL